MYVKYVKNLMVHITHYVHSNMSKPGILGENKVPSIKIIKMMMMLGILASIRIT